MTNNDPEFWAQQALAFTARVRAAADALGDAIHAAAELGLMREQHDLAGLRTAIVGGQALDRERDGAVFRLEGRVAMIEAKIDRLLAGQCATCPLRPGDLGEAE